MTASLPIVDFTAVPYRPAAYEIRHITHTRVNDPRTTHRVWVRIKAGHGVMDAVKFLIEGETSFEDESWYAIAT